MRIFPARFFITRPTYFNLKPQVSFFLYYQKYRYRTFDVVVIYGRYNPTFNITSFIDITDKPKVSAYQYQEYQFSDQNTETSDSYSQKTLTIYTYDYLDQTYANDFYQIDTVNVITYEFSDQNTRTTDSYAGFGQYNQRQEIYRDTTSGSDKVTVTEPMPQYVPDVTFIVPGRFQVVNSTINTAFIENYRYVTQTPRGKQVNNYETVGIQDIVALKYFPPPQQKYYSNGYLIVMYENGIYQVGTFTSFNYVTLESGQPRLVPSERSTIYYYQPLSATFTEQINMSGTVRPYPEFQSYIPNVYLYHFYERCPVEEISGFMYYAPDFELGILATVTDWIEDVSIEDIYDIRLHTPQATIVKYSESVTITDSIKIETLVSELEFEEAIDVRDQYEIAIPQYIIGEVESVTVTDQYLISIASIVTIVSAQYTREIITSPAEIRGYTTIYSAQYTRKLIANPSEPTAKVVMTHPSSITRRIISAPY